MTSKEASKEADRFHISLRACVLHVQPHRFLSQKAPHLLGGHVDIWDVIVLAQHRDVGDDINGRNVSGNQADPAQPSSTNPQSGRQFQSHKSDPCEGPTVELYPGLR